jgi:alkaline phosphatase D
VAAAAGFDEMSSVYRYVVTDIEKTFQEGNPGLVFSDTEANGFLVVEVHADDAQASFFTIPGTEVKNDYAGRDQDLSQKVRVTNLTVGPGSIKPRA